MSIGYYTLDADGNVTPTTDFMAAFNEDMKRVAFDRIDGPQGSFDVSTVFLGLDHSFGGGPPLVFETMIFGGDWSGEYCERYSTIEQARAGHAVAVQVVRDGKVGE